jgi:hypothetical protein
MGINEWLTKTTMPKSVGWSESNRRSIRRDPNEY